MYKLGPLTNIFVIINCNVLYDLDILHEGHKKLEERVLTMESALTKTKKELLETKKEVAILSLFGEVGRSTKHVSHKSPRLKPRDQTIAFFFSGLQFHGFVNY